MSPRLDKRWEISQPVPPAVDSALAIYPPLVRQLLYNRGIETQHRQRRFSMGRCF